MNNDIRRLISLILIAAGVIWLVSTGLCTLAFMAFVVQANGLTSTNLQTMLIVAGPSTLIGVGLYVFGRRLRPQAP